MAELLQSPARKNAAGDRKDFPRLPPLESLRVVPVTQPDADEVLRDEGTRLCRRVELRGWRPSMWETLKKAVARLAGFG